MPAEPRLKGRRILITGAASGIGAATAALFKNEGAALALLDRNAGKLEATAQELGAAWTAADVSDATAVRNAVNKLALALGGLDGVVNAAGISVIAAFGETDEALWQKALEVNLSGPYRVSHAALPFLQQAERASIVNISTAAALQPLMRRSAYAASKGGLLALTKVMAMELAPKIRANVIVPGAIDTPMVSNSFSGAALEAVVARYALKRLGTAEEVANAILFLISDESAFITGSTLSVDGGRIYY